MSRPQPSTEAQPRRLAATPDQRRLNLLADAARAEQLTDAWTRRSGIADPVILVAQRTDEAGARFIPRNYIAPIFVGPVSARAVADVLAEDPGTRESAEALRAVDTSRPHAFVLAEGGVIGGALAVRWTLDGIDVSTTSANDA